MKNRLKNCIHLIQPTSIFMLEITISFFPLVDVGVCDHPLNPLPLSEIKYLDVCYVVCIDCAYIIKNGEELIFSGSSPKAYVNYINIHISGNSLLSGENNSFDIFCKRGFLKVTPNFRLNDVQWLSENQIKTNYFQDFLSNFNDIEFTGENFEKLS